jgi:hypothetical protein
LPWRGWPVGDRVASFLFVSILAEIGLGLTFATGFLLVARGFSFFGSLIVSPSCGDLFYGLPFPWRLAENCRGVLDGSSFIVDALAYMAVGYVLWAGVERRRRGFQIEHTNVFFLATFYAAGVLLLSMYYDLNVLWSVQVYTLLSFVLSFSTVLVSGIMLFILGQRSVRACLSSAGFTLDLLRKALLVYGLLLLYLVVAYALYTLNQIFLPLGNLVFWAIATLNIVGVIGALSFTYLSRSAQTVKATGRSPSSI